LLACRGDGGQTIVPQSTHATGELIDFSEMGDPGEADYDELLLQCKLIATAIELAPQWKEGSRHDLSLAIAGSLLRAGVPFEGVHKVIRAICLLCSDDELEDRITTIRSTVEKLMS
jgi:hypothetical protein